MYIVFVYFELFLLDFISLLQCLFERSQSPVDTNFQPDDLVTLPVIQSLPTEGTVRNSTQAKLSCLH